MIRTMLLALAASLLPSAAFAQTQTPALTTATPLTANSGDQNIKLSKARAPFKKGAVIKLCPVTDVTPAFTYVAKAATCPTPVAVPIPEPEPTPTPAPTPASTVTIAGKEAFLSSPELVVGFGAFGNVGSRYAAPAAFRDTSEVYQRKGFYIRGTRSDVILPGAPVDTWAIAYTYRGVRYRFFQGEIFGKTQIPGAHDAATGAWSGAVGCIGVTQAPAIEQATLRLTVTIRNTCPDAISGVRYLRSQDPNDGEADAGLTARKIVAAGAVEARLRGVSSGMTYRLSSDPRFTASIYGVGAVESPDRAEWTSQPVGYAPRVTALGNVNLLGQLGTLKTAEATTFALDMGVSR